MVKEQKMEQEITSKKFLFSATRAARLSLVNKK